MKPIALIHFAPVEHYPPLQNFMAELERRSLHANVYTTRNQLHVFKTFESKNTVSIIRLRQVGIRSRALVRLVNYCYFYGNTLVRLLLLRPACVMYFDTISSWPALVYCKFFRVAKLFIHYHEYVSKVEYDQGMRLVKHLHKIELKHYGKAAWISQTNAARMEKFVADIFPVKINHGEILPNYPPKSWIVKEPRQESAGPLKVVYVGSFSLQTMFVRTFSDWVLAQNGKVVWDIYSHNFTDEAYQYIKSLDTPFISIKPGVDYNDLPRVLHEYSVGVILYNGHIPNYIFNAPNKLFEYFSCGLDVWFPDIMKSSLPYATSQTFPKIVPMDFNNLSGLKPEDLYSRKGLHFQPATLSAEEALDKVIEKLDAGTRSLITATDR